MTACSLILLGHVITSQHNPQVINFFTTWKPLLESKIVLFYKLLLSSWVKYYFSFRTLKNTSLLNNKRIGNQLI